MRQMRTASANKGGVTSSSLEVLVGLGLNDAEYIELMTQQKSSGFSDLSDPPISPALSMRLTIEDSYTSYVRDIQRTISLNAVSHPSLRGQAVVAEGARRCAGRGVQLHLERIDGGSHTTGGPHRRSGPSSPSSRRGR